MRGYGWGGLKKVNFLPARLQHGAKTRLWNRVHSAFDVLAAKDIPADQLDNARNFIAAYAIEGEYIPKINPFPSAQLSLHYHERFPGKDYLSYREMYPGTWDVNLLGLICNLEQYEGRVVPLQVSGTRVLKRELMSLMLMVDEQARKLAEIKRLANQ